MTRVVIFAALVTICWLAPAVALCPCDCNGDNRVTVAELVRALNIALGGQPIDVCQRPYCLGSDCFRIQIVVSCVDYALRGCPMVPDATPTIGLPPPTPTATHEPIVSVSGL
jgi:hypothetical protein